MMMFHVLILNQKLSVMKNKIKLLATGLVIFLGSNSFAQSTKITGLPDVVPAVREVSLTKGDLTFLQGLRQKNPEFAKQLALDMRGFENRGLTGKDLRRAMKKDMNDMRQDRQQAAHKEFIHKLSSDHPKLAKFVASHRNLIPNNGRQIVQHRAAIAKRVEAHRGTR